MAPSRRRRPRSTPARGRRPTRHRPRGGRGGAEPRAVVRDREARAWRLSAQGWTQREIAVELGISQPAVSKLLHRVERSVVVTADDVAAYKARHASKLEFLHRELTGAWLASKGESTRRRQRRSETTRGAGPGAPATTMAELAVEQRHGDAAYLETARKVLADFGRLWGLEAPRQLALRTGRPLEGLSDEELTTALAEQARRVAQADEDDPAGEGD